MKKHLLTLILSLALTALTAHNIWKPIGMEGEFLGVSADGSLFSNWGYSGFHRSQDEGATWQLNYDLSYVSSKHFTINDNNRIFIFNQNNYRLYYSDNNGDTWQEQTSGISTNWVEGMYSLSNDTIFMANRNMFFWTLDGGESWNETSIDFVGDALFGSILADHAGNLYVSTYLYSTYPQPGVQTGIYTATMDEMDNWTVKVPYGARDLAFDSERNILASSEGAYMFENGVYFVNADRFALTDDDVIFAMKRMDWYSEALFYSTDHGETYSRFGENIASTQTVPDPDLGLFKGRDNHLYCHAEVWEPSYECRFYKSMNEADLIVDPNVQYQQGWQKLLTGVTEDLFGVCCINQTDVVACGENGKILKTTDGGNSWDVVYEKPGYDMIHVAFSSSEVGFACGDSSAWDEANHKGIIVKTTDGGATWNELPNTEFVSLDQPSWVQNNKFVVIPYGNECRLYLFDDNGILWHSDDSGQTFSSHQFNFGRIDYCDMYMEISYDNIAGCLMVADVDAQFQRRLHVFITTDGGATWTEKLTLDCESWHQFVAMFTAYDLVELYGYFNNGENNLLVTSNGFDTYFYSNTESDVLDEYAGDFSRAKFSDSYGCVLFGMGLDKGSAEWFPILIENGWWQGECEMNHLGIPYCYNDGMTHCRDLNCIDGLGTSFFIASEDGIVYKSGVVPVDGSAFPRGTEWYYEIKHITGDVTYQHLEYATDTAINSRRVKIITETNTMYDKSEWVDYEYIYEDGDRIYWWNKETEAFTLLYDFGAEVGDEWVIDGGWYSITVHVDAAHTVTYKSETYRVLSVSDPSHLFTGDIICGIGHTKSFFPETPIAKDYEVDGLRCYWQDGELVLTMGQEDCDAVYNSIHTELNENAKTTFTVYPNPATNQLVITLTPNTVIPSITKSHNPVIPPTFHLANLLGQTVASGLLTSNPHQIDVQSLPSGMYFLTIANQTQKIILHHLP